MRKIAARRAHMDLDPRQDVEAGARGNFGAGDHHLVHALHEGQAEVDLPGPLLRDGQRAGGDVRLAVDEPLENLVAARWDDHPGEIAVLHAAFLLEALLEGDRRQAWRREGQEGVSTCTYR